MIRQIVHDIKVKSWKENSNSQQEKRSKETNLEDGTRKKHLQRKINVDDMPTGKGVESFNLKQEIICGGPRITWPQLLQISPSLKKEWGVYRVYNKI